MLTACPDFADTDMLFAKAVGIDFKLPEVYHAVDAMSDSNSSRNCLGIQMCTSEAPSSKCRGLTLNWVPELLLWALIGDGCS